MNPAIGYALAILIGATLGLFGGGGSILAVPLLVYAFGLPAGLAATTSLLVIGVTSGLAAIGHVRSGDVRLRESLAFAIPSLISVAIMRRVLVPAIPSQILLPFGVHVSKDHLVFTAFAAFMLVASVAMILPREIKPNESAGRARLIAQGIFAGAVTGFVGAGGGFLIVPALVMVVKMPMKAAVGTSLLIISANALVGFGLDPAISTVSWEIAGGVTGFATLGTLLGTLAATRVSGQTLKPAFGWFVLTVGTAVAINQIFFTKA